MEMYLFVNFTRILKGVWHEIFGENWFMKKTWSWKSRVRLPLKRAVNSDRDLGNAILCTRGIFNCPHAGVYGVHYNILYFGGERTRVSDFVTLLALWCTASTHIRGLWKKFLYRTACFTLYLYSMTIPENQSCRSTRPWRPCPPSQALVCGTGFPL